MKIINSNTAAIDLGSILKNNHFNIYYHSDIDGTTSAVLLTHYITAKYNFELDNIRTYPVDYNIGKVWHRTKLVKPCAVLDFLYHQNAIVWYDHHKDPFLNNHSLQIDYQRRSAQDSKRFYWDKDATSVSLMLFDVLKTFFENDRAHIFADIELLVKQVDRIDSAKYSSPDEWFNCDFEAAKLNQILNHNRDSNPEFINKLFKDLILNGCSGTINTPQYKKLFQMAMSQIENDYKLASEIFQYIDNIVLYDATVKGQGAFNRFFPYISNPYADFVVGIYQKGDCFEVSVGKNPWKKNGNRISIGKLCTELGGGGHEKVGGITLQTYQEATEMARIVIHQLSK